MCAHKPDDERYSWYLIVFETVKCKVNGTKRFVLTWKQFDGEFDLRTDEKIEILF